MGGGSLVGHYHYRSSCRSKQKRGSVCVASTSLMTPHRDSDILTADNIRLFSRNCRQKRPDRLQSWVILPVFEICFFYLLLWGFQNIILYCQMCYHLVCILRKMDDVFRWNTNWRFHVEWVPKSVTSDDILITYKWGGKLKAGEQIVFQPKAATGFSERPAS